MIVRLIIQDTDEGLRATLWTQNDPGEAESKSSEAFLVKTKAEARKKARVSGLRRHVGINDPALGGYEIERSPEYP